jgi:hypothetical protein
MIQIPAGARVVLAMQPVDFPNYAEPKIMRSPRRRWERRRGVETIFTPHNPRIC